MPKLQLLYSYHGAGTGTHLCHLATSKLFDTIEMVTVPFVNSGQIIILTAQGVSFSVKGKRYIRVIVAISVSMKRDWLTAQSLFDVRYAIATAPVKILDKVAIWTLSPYVLTIKKKIKNRTVLFCPLPGHDTQFFRG